MLPRTQAKFFDDSLGHVLVHLGFRVSGVGFRPDSKCFRAECRGSGRRSYDGWSLHPPSGGHVRAAVAAGLPAVHVPPGEHHLGRPLLGLELAANQQVLCHQYQRKWRQLRRADSMKVLAAQTCARRSNLRRRSDDVMMLVADALMASWVSEVSELSCSLRGSWALADR